MRFTFSYIEYKKDVFEKYLKPCLDNIIDNVDIISKPNIKPSKFFNLVQKESPNKYIIFSHEDITFSHNLLEQIEKCISETPNFGVLCIVGKDEFNKNIGSLASTKYELKFCDPCFFVINKDNDFKFDEIIFDDFHFCVEDYCIGIKEKMNKGTYSLPLNWGKSHLDSEGRILLNNIQHHSYTCRTVKYQWGNYIEYKKRLKKKWGHLTNIKNF
jgi:hypothetical protein